jgi:hypothetical protein
VLAVSLGLTVAILPLLLRVFTKIYIIRQMKIEDYLLILSAAGLIGYSPVLVVASHTGQGIHQWDLTVKQFQRTLNVCKFPHESIGIRFTVKPLTGCKITNILEIIYCLDILPAKLSVLIQLKRIFVVSRTSQYFWLANIFIVGNFCSYVALTLSVALTCVPREKIWTPDLPGHCIDSTASVVASAVINIVSDITILVLPVFAVWQLQLPVRSKIMVSAAFGSGVL